MAHKGKMNSSPFHVESVTYAYAIEHENSGYNVPEKAVKCDCLVRSTNACTLWNSGYKNCFAYKCRYGGGIKKRDARCKSCAFYLKKCRNPKKPQNKQISTEEAAFCCYYIGTGMEPKYSQIRRCVLRIAYTSEYRTLQSDIDKRNKTIRKFQKELQACDKSSSDYKYLQDKIEEKKNLSEQNRARMANLKAQLDKLGGPLEKWEFKEPRKRRIT